MGHRSACATASRQRRVSEKLPTSRRPEGPQWFSAAFVDLKTRCALDRTHPDYFGDFGTHFRNSFNDTSLLLQVNPGSKAAQQGVREGDLISNINDRSTRDLTNSEAHALLRNSGEQLKLGLNQ